MDLALTFHVGLSLRIPSNGRQSLADLNIKPLMACWRTFQEATDALSQAEELKDFRQSVCHSAQDLIEISIAEDTPERSDFRGWSLRVSVDSVGKKLSFNQLALWKRERSAPGTVNHIGLAFRLVGFFDYGVLQRSLAAVCVRHDILRMKISGAPDDYQISFAAPESCSLPLLRFDQNGRLDKEAQLNIVRSFVRRPPDLKDGTTSLELLRFDAGEHVLVMRLHQIAFDGWATRLFLRELVQAFTEEASGNALSLPSVMQYIDVAREEHARAQAGLFDSQIDYLRNAALSPPKSVVKINSNKEEGRAEFFISSDEYARIKNTAARQKTTSFSFFLAAYVVALSPLVRQQWLIITITSAGRSGSGCDSVIGPFANDLPIRIELPPTYEQLLKQVREGIVEAVAHENVPWGYLATQLAADGFSLPSSSLRAALVLHQEQQQTPAFPGIQVEPLDIDCAVASSYDLRLSISPIEEILRCRIRFNTQVVEEHQANRVVAEFLRALAAMVNDPNSEIGPP